MINLIATKVVEKYINKGILKLTDKEMYVYCFEILISTLINGIILLSIGFGTQHYISTIVFIIVFRALRSATGGYHANTHLKCFLTLIINFSLLIVMLEFIEVNILNYIAILIMVSSLFIITILGPVDNINKRLTIYEKSKKRLLCSIYYFVCIFTYCILIYFEGTKIYGFTISFTVMSVAVSLIIGKLEDKIRAKHTLGLRVIRYIP